MNESQIENMNKNISYEEGIIYWEQNKGYTSKLIKRLHKQGYTTVKSGAIHILKDKEGKEMLTAYSWPGLLFETAKLFV